MTYDELERAQYGGAGGGGGDECRFSHI